MRKLAEPCPGDALPPSTPLSCPSPTFKVVAQEEGRGVQGHHVPGNPCESSNPNAPPSEARRAPRTPSLSLTLPLPPALVPIEQRWGCQLGVRSKRGQSKAGTLGRIGKHARLHSTQALPERPAVTAPPTFPRHRPGHSAVCVLEGLSLALPHPWVL